MKIFGREPTVILQAVSAVMAILVAFGLPGLSDEQATLIIAVLAAIIGAVNASLTRPIAPAAFVGLITAGAALLAGFGLEASQEVVGTIAAAVPAILALLTRVQVTPTGDPRPADQVVG